ncbi:aspartic peptidase domain-containing protein [Exophiala viscosa]|uniref:aspartic peptidase domain-containing protein n=1 Tax=Exophiala viscosa TaxID=2486360 RepID=UPI00218F8613|nr:aspartic peptidase domain-containing protein [Exophiala viscosa]
MSLPFFASSFLVFLLQCRPVAGQAADDSPSPPPIIFQPSRYWDGDGDHWSTFAIQIGTPPQVVRLLPSITGNSIFPVENLACYETTDLEVSDCPNSRGLVFDPKNSSTYQDDGEVALPTNPEHWLYPNGEQAIIGFDNVTLDYPHYTNINLPNVTIFPYLGDDFWIGSFGINPTINDTEADDFNVALPTFMGVLRQQNLIPSLSWGYHAGACYRNPPFPQFASLTLGGYDKSRMNVSTNLTLSSQGDEYRPFLLGIESITMKDEVLLESPLTDVGLDNQVTSLWLPLVVCQKFEEAFGLIWNATSEMYFVNDSQHSTLIQQNPNVTFTLSDGLPGSTARLNIILPYQAFDLQTTPPMGDNKTHNYFPLKQAANESQYTLGLTIFQEMYMVADYEHGPISLFQVLYPTNGSAEIMTICAKNSTTCGSSGGSSSNALSAGAIAGIVIGAAMALLIIIAAVWYKWLRKPKYMPASSQRDSSGTFGGTEKAELDGSARTPRNEHDGFYAPQKPELDSGYESRHVPTGSGSGTGSRPGDSRSQPGGSEEAHEAGGEELQEMGTATLRRSELPGDGGRYELYGSMPMRFRKI